MGNGASGIICLTPGVGCDGMAGAPMLLLGATLLFLIWFPVLIHTLEGGRSIRDVVSISEMWRLPMIPTVISMVMVPMLVVYSICLSGWQIMLLLWSGAILLFCVVAVNPNPPPPDADADCERGIRRLQTVHGTCAFALFTLMLTVALTLITTTFIGNSSFIPALLLVFIICALYVALVASALKWCPKTSLYEIVFATNFLILLSLINEEGTC